MVVAVHDLLEALSSMGITVEARNGSLRYRPASAMTPSLLAAVKSCKGELIRLLREPADAVPAPEAAPLPRGPGAGSGAATPILARATPLRDSIAQSRGDAEFARFAAVAAPMADGSGWYDPTQEPVPVGVPWLDWQRFERDCASLGRKKKSAAGGGIQSNRRRRRHE